MSKLSGGVDIRFSITSITRFSDNKGSGLVDVTKTIDDSDLVKIVNRVREYAIDSSAKFPSFTKGTFDFKEYIYGKHYSVSGRYTVN